MPFSGLLMLLDLASSANLRQIYSENTQQIRQPSLHRSLKAEGNERC